MWLFSQLFGVETFMYLTFATATQLHNNDFNDNRPLLLIEAMPAKVFCELPRNGYVCTMCLYI